MEDTNFATWTPSNTCSVCGFRAPSPHHLGTICPNCYRIMSNWNLKPKGAYGHEVKVDRVCEESSR